VPRLIGYPDRELEIRIVGSSSTGRLGMIAFEACGPFELDGDPNWTLVLDDGEPRTVVMFEAPLAPGVTTWRAWFR